MMLSEMRRGEGRQREVERRGASGLNLTKDEVEDGGQAGQHVVPQLEPCSDQAYHHLVIEYVRYTVRSHTWALTEHIGIS